ncbi:MAG: cytochrome c-type biogenesis protein CcmH [Anaerolineae bacterium]|nr:cytochrome c-type biogenesis protein CcmH [Anaerolineae bacterium]
MPQTSRRRAHHRHALAGRALCLALALGLAIAVGSAAAQTASPPTLDQVNAVARELYCPLCNGIRLDACDLQVCAQMRDVIADRLAAGATKDQIKAEFVAQYGPTVLGEPPRQGLNWLGWLLPAGALAAAGLWLGFQVRRWTRSAAPEAGPAAAAPGSHAPDPYLARVEQDLAHLD